MNLTRHPHLGCASGHTVVDEVETTTRWVVRVEARSTAALELPDRFSCEAHRGEGSVGDVVSGKRSRAMAVMTAKASA
jgi:hypothetical protein